MTDKEKETIEQLRSWRKYIIKHKKDVNKANDIEFYLRTAINLIEKQSKEIEELNKSDTSKEQSSIKYYNLYKELVDKIKAKIEEVEQWELYNMKIPKLSTLDERLGAKIGIKYALQTLLEKE